MLGNGRLEAQCFDGEKRLALIRGKMRKKVWINTGDIILLSLREFQDEKADVIQKYTPDEARGEFSRRNEKKSCVERRSFTDSPSHSRFSLQTWSSTARSQHRPRSTRQRKVARKVARSSSKRTRETTTTTTWTISEEKRRKTRVKQLAGPRGEQQQQLDLPLVVRPTFRLWFSIRVAQARCAHERFDCAIQCALRNNRCHSVHTQRLMRSIRSSGQNTKVWLMEQSHHC